MVKKDKKRKIKGKIEKKRNFLRKIVKKSSK